MVEEGLDQPHAAHRVHDRLGRHVTLVTAHPLLGELAGGAARGAAATAALAADDGLVQVVGGSKVLHGGRAGAGGA